jgi:hypothetical protein
MLLSRAARREFRRQTMADRLRRLAEVDVQPAGTTQGRVITVVVRAKGAGAFDARAYLRPWWTTVNRMGLRGTILAAGLRSDEAAALQTDRIEVVAVEPGPRHIFHERHFLVRDFLRSIDDPWVFVTDAADVAFKRDPFELVAAAGDARRLFIGRERRRILFCKCVRREMLRQFGAVWFPWRPVLNPGILGGRRDVVLEALEGITQLIEAQGERLECSDMCLVNRAIHAAFSPQELVTGYPLHSRFKGWEFATSAAILHK